MHYAYGYWGNQTGIAYDPEKITDEELPQSVEDFAKFFTERPGEYGFNYENGGSGPSYYQNMLRVMTGVDFSDGEVTDARIAALPEPHRPYALGIYANAVASKLSQHSPC